MGKKKEVEEVKKENVCGIISLCTGWAFPLIGIILGIIALARKERSTWMGIVGIVTSIVFWLFWAVIIIAMGLM